MSTAVLFIITQNQKPPKCPSTSEWIRKLVCPFSEYPTVMGNEPQFAQQHRPIGSLCILLSERSQVATQHLIPFYDIMEKSKPQGQKTDQWLPEVEGWGRGTPQLHTRLFLRQWTCYMWYQGDGHKVCLCSNAQNHTPQSQLHLTQSQKNTQLGSSGNSRMQQRL